GERSRLGGEALTPHPSTERVSEHSSHQETGGAIGTSPRTQTEENAQFWKEYLQGSPALLELPSDHSRPATQQCRAAEEQRIFSPKPAAGVRQLNSIPGIAEADV